MLSGVTPKRSSSGQRSASRPESRQASGTLTWRRARVGPWTHGVAQVRVARAWLGPLWTMDWFPGRVMKAPGLRRAWRSATDGRFRWKFGPGGRSGLGSTRVGGLGWDSAVDGWPGHGSRVDGQFVGLRQSGHAGCDLAGMGGLGHEARSRTVADAALRTGQPTAEVRGLERPTSTGSFGVGVRCQFPGLPLPIRLNARSRAATPDVATAGSHRSSPCCAWRIGPAWLRRMPECVVNRGSADS